MGVCAHLWESRSKLASAEPVSGLCVRHCERSVWRHFLVHSAIGLDEVQPLSPHEFPDLRESFMPQSRMTGQAQSSLRASHAMLHT